jgi:hypothetical protein
VGDRGDTGHVAFFLEVGFDGDRPEIASGVLVEVEEAVSPDLDDGGSIFGSESGVNSVDFRLK